jgi:hypothetical protein
MIAVEDHPRDGASMMPHKRSPSPTMERTDPTGSGGEAFAVREFGISQTAATRPRTAIGTFIKKTDPHQK